MSSNMECVSVSKYTFTMLYGHVRDKLAIVTASSLTWANCMTGLTATFTAWIESMNVGHWSKDR